MSSGIIALSGQCLEAVAAVKERLLSLLQAVAASEPRLFNVPRNNNAGAQVLPAPLAWATCRVRVRWWLRVGLLLSRKKQIKACDAPLLGLRRISPSCSSVERGRTSQDLRCEHCSNSSVASPITIHQDPEH